jgi:hypothetical protein
MIAVAVAALAFATWKAIERFMAPNVGEAVVVPDPDPFTDQNYRP